MDQLEIQSARLAGSKQNKTEKNCYVSKYTFYLTGVQNTVSCCLGEYSICILTNMYFYYYCVHVCREHVPQSACSSTAEHVTGALGLQLHPHQKRLHHNDSTLVACVAVLYFTFPIVQTESRVGTAESTGLLAWSW